MKKYNFYNKEYGIMLKLTLDGERNILKYKCFNIPQGYHPDLYYKHKNGWSIRFFDTILFPIMLCSEKILCFPSVFCNVDVEMIITKKRRKSKGGKLRYNKKRIIYDDDYRDELYDYYIFEDHEWLKKMYYELIEMLEEIGNDEDQARLFLDM